MRDQAIKILVLGNALVQMKKSIERIQRIPHLKARHGVFASPCPFAFACLTPALHLGLRPARARLKSKSNSSVSRVNGEAHQGIPVGPRDIPLCSRYDLSP